MAGGLPADRAARARDELSARLGRVVVGPDPQGYQQLVDVIAEF